MFSELLARLRSLWRGLRQSGDVHAEMTEEFRHHLELRTEDLIRQGVPPDQAARQARLEFGHIESHQQDARASRGLRIFDEFGFYWLDAKLGLRMLKKYPGLSIVSVVGMAVAIAIAAGGFGFIQSMLDPTVPLDEGERIVSMQNANLREAGNPDRQSLHDFVIWRDEVESVEDLAAYTADQRNLIFPRGPVELVRIAQMTASGFRVARTAPVLGRTLIDEDERVDSPPVVVIAYEEWQRLFAGDSGVVGRQVRLGATLHTIVGVMPEDFRFPLFQRYWVPLRLDPADYEMGGGPGIFMFGRLREGATLREARAELGTISRRMAAAYPDTHEHLRAQILPYTHPYLDVDNTATALALRGVQGAISLLLIVVAVNVAILVYARTATRAGEIAVRTALGASRRRVVVQLFVEALVLSTAAAIIGITLASTGLDITEAVILEDVGELPFWFTLGLSPSLVVYVLGLALLGGGIVGVFPALKATGRQMQQGLQQISSRGSGLQLGRTWTVLIVTQVAVAVTVLPFAVRTTAQALRRAIMNPGYPTEQFLRTTLSMESRREAIPDDQAAAYEQQFQTRFRNRAAEFLRRLEREPEVAGVTFGSDFPEGGTMLRFEVESSSSALGGGSIRRWARINESGIDLLRLFNVQVVTGRHFVEADARDGSNTVIVDRVFAERILGNTSVLGRRIRVIRRNSNADAGEVEVGPWLEIVGVVPDFMIQYYFDPTDSELYQTEPRVYQAMALERAPAGLNVSIRTRGRAAVFAGRMREIAAAVDPTLQLRDVHTESERHHGARMGMLSGSALIVVVTGSVLLLSAAGIYAMMSFTVARGRREIGIRSALGADPRRLLTSIFARAGARLGGGMLCGLLLATAADWAGRGSPTGTSTLLICTVGLFMFVIGLLATVGPARCGLAIQPTEALRED